MNHRSAPRPHSRRPTAIGAPWLGAIYVAVVLLPLVAALSGGSGHGLPLMRLSAAAGTAGAAMVLLQMLSSGRFERLSGGVGIDVTMAFHKWAAPVALFLSALHVAALVGPPDPDRPGRVARRAQLFWSSDALLDARLALLLLALLVIVALLRDRLPLRYETFRATHALGAVALVGLLTWHILGDARGGTSTTTFWLALTAACVLPALWVYGRRLSTPDDALWSVAETRPIADGLWELLLTPPQRGGLAFAAGQFAWMAVGRRRLPLWDHPFSIASAPDDPRIRFIIQEAGDFTSAIGDLAPGTRVALDAPHGRFGVGDDSSGPVVLIAGGVGIAPILSILTDLASRAGTRKVRLIYAARSPSAMIPPELYLPSCERLGLRPVLLVDEGAEATPGLGQGPLRPEHLAEALQGLESARTTALICGPGPMMTAAADALWRLGVPLGQIDYERFSYSAGGASAKDRRRLLAFAATFAAICAGVVAYSAL
ncbi:ferredoxin reductase family protein [Palleronia sp. KMU-117]|uniref:ferredoxin reductase family protein n=1 Tax=Palleronia sp. KMU-117 TaxID=3434108 RepID=UPI003D74C418